MPYGDGWCYIHWNIIVMASATIEFATRMGSLFRQQVRALEKEKLILVSLMLIRMNAVLEMNSVGEASKFAIYWVSAIA